MVSQDLPAALPVRPVATSNGLPKKLKLDTFARNSAEDERLTLSKFYDARAFPSAKSLPPTPLPEKSNSISEQPPAPEKKLPPLLALPLPLKQHIFAYLDEPHNLSLFFLRRTHPILRQSIPRGYSSNRQTRKCQLWTAEREHPYLFRRGYYPCYCCLVVYPRRCFSRRYSHEAELERRCIFCTRVWHPRFLDGD